MKAAYIEQVGSPDNILIGELPIPTISEKEILVKVTYTTVNHIDCYIRAGKYPRALPKPFIIGRDFCGEVAQVGKQVKNFKVGDKVWSNSQGINGHQGTFAEYLAVTEETLFHLPANVDPQEAITVFHSAFTALIGLEREAQLTRGDIIYVHGAAGNIGAAVVQIAKLHQARVIAGTSGQKKIDYCRQIGADDVIDYKQDIKSAINRIAPRGINVFWNTYRLHDFKLSLPLLADKGRYILMAGSGTEAVLPIGEVYTKDISIRGFTITNATLAEVQVTADKINQMLEKGLIKIKIEDVLPLKATGEAHRRMEAGNVWGKIIIKI